MVNVSRTAMKTNAPTKLTIAPNMQHVSISATVLSVNVTTDTTVADKCVVMKNNASPTHAVKILDVLRNARATNVSARITTTDQLLVMVEPVFSTVNTRTNVTVLSVVNTPSVVTEPVTAERDTTRTVMTASQR